MPHLLKRCKHQITQVDVKMLQHLRVITICEIQIQEELEIHVIEGLLHLMKKSRHSNLEPLCKTKRCSRLMCQICIVAIKVIFYI